jgi:hypothetical protein
MQYGVYKLDQSCTARWKCALDYTKTRRAERDTFLVYAHLARSAFSHARSTSITGRQQQRDRDASEEEIGKPMLDNMSSGKRLPEKRSLVLSAMSALKEEQS